MFGSTSPSYLILQSLDMVNVYLVSGYRHQLKERIQQVREMKEALIQQGYELTGNEPMKVTIRPKSYGYTGQELANLLQRNSVFCEYADPDHLVLMMSPELGPSGVKRAQEELLNIPQLPAIEDAPPPFRRCNVEMSIRQAVLSPCRTLPSDHSLGRILASPSVGCPPAVPIAICGERIDLATIQRFRYYGIRRVTVLNDF
jgi:arginine/lysine/ornithine decarboxylase